MCPPKNWRTLPNPGQYLDDVISTEMNAQIERLDQAIQDMKEYLLEELADLRHQIWEATYGR